MNHSLQSLRQCFLDNISYFHVHGTIHSNIYFKILSLGLLQPEEGAPPLRSSSGRLIQRPASYHELLLSAATDNSSDSDFGDSYSVSFGFEYDLDIFVLLFYKDLIKDDDDDGKGSRSSNIIYSLTIFCSIRAKFACFTSSCMAKHIFVRKSVVLHLREGPD